MLVFKSGQNNTPSFRPLTLPDTRECEVEGLPDPAGSTHSETLSQLLRRQAAEAAMPFVHHSIDSIDSSSLTDLARSEAAQIIADAQKQAAEMERSIRDKALADARERIAADAESAVAPLRAQLAETLAETASFRELLAQHAEREIVQLAMEIARKIVRREVTVDQEIVVSLARVALARLHSRTLAVIRLHPDDYQYVQMHRDRLGSGSSLKLVEDPSITRGGCLIETDLGDVDARIEQQFGEIEKGFLNLDS